MRFEQSETQSLKIVRIRRWSVLETKWHMLKPLREQQLIVANIRRSWQYSRSPVLSFLPMLMRTTDW
jgi:hypothetical protein